MMPGAYQILPITTMNIPDYNSPRNWTEDYPDDNGQYFHNCVTCQQSFIGHKRRVQCKECDQKQAVFTENAKKALEKNEPAKAFINPSFLTYDKGFVDGYVHAGFFDKSENEVDMTAQEALRWYADEVSALEKHKGTDAMLSVITVLTSDKGERALKVLARLSDRDKL